MGVMMFAVAVGVRREEGGDGRVWRARKWLGAALLMWLAWKIATARPHGADAGGKPVGFLGAAAFQWINPKSWLVCASAAGTYLAAGSGSAFAQAMVFGALFVLASLPPCFVWLAFGATAQQFLRTERAGRTFNVAMGVLLAGSVLLILR